jgi:hypothetical protein
MRQIAFCSCLAVLVACAKTEKQPAADVAAAPPADASAAAPAAPAALSLTDLAGKWAMRATTGSGDTTIVSFVMVASADRSAWTFTFPKRKPIPVRVVALEGDSIVTEAGPYESVLRKGVQVTTHNTLRLQDGKLVGTTVAHYTTSRPDSVVQLRVEGTRAP